MDKAFVDILQKLKAEQGKEALLNPAKCKAFINDYAGNEYKKEKRFIVQAAEAGVSKAIDGAGDLASCKKAQARELVDEFGLSSDIAADIADTLAQVLRGDKTRTQAKTKTTPSKPAPQTASPAQPAVTPEAAKLVPENDFVFDYGYSVFGGSTRGIIKEYRGEDKAIRIPPLILGSEVEVIGVDAFRGKLLSSVALPSGLYYIDDGAFMDNQLSSVFIPNGVDSIGDCAFMNNQLNSVKIPDSVDYIGYCAFSGNQLSSVTVPADAYVHEEAFDSEVTVTRRKKY